MHFPVQRILTEKRKLIVPLAGGLLLNAAIYAVAVYPLSVRVRGTENREAAARSELTVTERNHAGARAVVEGKDRTDAALKTFYKDVLPGDLTGARRITYLRLARLAEQEHLQSARRSAEPDPDPSSTLGRLKITMVLQGEYEDVRRFIYQLESAPEFVIIEDVALAQGSEASSPLILTLALSTYYHAGAHGT